VEQETEIGLRLGCFFQWVFRTDCRLFYTVDT